MHKLFRELFWEWCDRKHPWLRWWIIISAGLFLVVIWFLEWWCSLGLYILNYLFIRGAIQAYLAEWYSKTKR